MGLTSRLVDANDATTTGGWTTNAAGFHFNNNYGFGLIDAGAFVDAAQQYSGVTPLVERTTPAVGVGVIPEDDPLGIRRQFQVSGDHGPLEEVILHVDYPTNSYYRQELQIELVAPFGTKSVLQLACGDVTFDNDYSFHDDGNWDTSATRSGVSPRSARGR